ncbi:MAG: hypothetical protein ACM34A_12565 [Bacillota bacterium]
MAATILKTIFMPQAPPYWDGAKVTPAAMKLPAIRGSSSSLTTIGWREKPKLYVKRSSGKDKLAPQDKSLQCKNKKRHPRMPF